MISRDKELFEVTPPNAAIKTATIRNLVKAFRHNRSQRQFHGTVFSFIDCLDSIYL